MDIKSTPLNTMKMSISPNELNELSEKSGLDKTTIRLWIRIEGKESTVKKLRSYIKKNEKTLTLQRKEKLKSDKAKRQHYACVESGQKIVIGHHQKKNNKQHC